MAATAEEEAIIKYRYLTQTVTTAAHVLPPLKSLAKRFYQFRAALQSGSLSEAEAVHGELQIDLHAIRAALDRQATSSRVASQEMEYYAAEQAKLEASIEEMGRVLESQKTDLAAARVQLDRWQQYEALKKQVAAVPARSVTRQEMETVRREIADLAEQRRQIDRLMDRRRRALAGVLTVLQATVAEIEADAPAEEGALPDTES